LNVKLTVVAAIDYWQHRCIVLYCITVFYRSSRQRS